MTRERRLWLFLAVPLVLVAIAAIFFWERPVRVYESLLEMRMRFEGAQSLETTVEGYRVHYYVMGPESGTPVVLVHGLGGRAEDWRNLAPYLTKAGFRVYIPDLPGYGESQRPADFSYSVRDEAAVVVGFFNAMGLKQVDLGGWSMGGWIVQLVAAWHPERVKRLILFDSVGIDEQPKWNTALFTPTTPNQLAQLDALLMPHPPPVPGYVARDILRTSKQNAWVIHRAVNSMLSGRDATDNLLPGLKMPVLIVWGSLDRIAPLEQAEKIHSLVPQSQLDVIQGCGHLAPEQCAAKIAPTLVAFVKQ